MGQLKPEIRNSKSETRVGKARIELRDRDTRLYDLESRTLQFAKDVRSFTRALPRGLANDQDIKQLVRASGSIGANYLEANNAVSRRDFVLRAKISRKEARETVYWLQLVECGSEARLEATRESLVREATELMKIFGAIVRKSE
ncbi:MAG: four helix bundle protein [Syntrophomonadaceae bacterium]